MQTDLNAETQRFAETRRGFLFFALLGFVLRPNYLVITQAIRQSQSSMNPWSGKPFALVPEPFPKFGRTSAEEEIMKIKFTTLDIGSTICAMIEPAPGRKSILDWLVRGLCAAVLVLPAFGTQAGVVLTSLHLFQASPDGKYPVGLGETTPPRPPATSTRLSPHSPPRAAGHIPPG